MTILNGVTFRPPVALIVGQDHSKSNRLVLGFCPTIP